MKNTVLLFIFMSFSVGLFAQNETGAKFIPWLESQDITNTRYFIWQGDTIDFNEFGRVLDRVDAEGDYLYFYSDTTLLDSAYLSYTAEIDTFMYSDGGDSIIISLNNDGLHYLDISSLTSKLDTVTRDNTLTGNGTSTSPLGVDESIIANAMKSNYKITLPVNGTLSGSAAAATDIPSGWSLSVSDGDLQINHGMGRYSSEVNIKYNTSGESYRQLRNFDNAYSGVLDVDNNNLTIESISTFYTAYELRITIIFE